MLNNCDCSPDAPCQWLFLGATVKSFNNQVGWGDAASTLSVELVEDTEGTCDGRLKKYLGEKFDTLTTDSPDPGFFGNQFNIIGRPVQFKFENFEFAGLVSDWSEGNSSNGTKIYNVNIESPTTLLGSAQVIIDGYVGPTSSVPNVLNVYGLLEGTDCSTFGGSENFGSGMPWNQIKLGISLLTGALTPAAFGYLDYLQSGRIKYLPGLSGGFGLIREDDTGYMIDLSELPTAPDYYRFAGSSINLLEAINQLADDAVVDWFVELVPCCIDSKIYKLIKIRAVDRSVPPAPNAIDRFITEYNTLGCGTISYDKGQEQRDDYLHSILIGPPREEIYDAFTTRGGTPARITTPVATGETEDEMIDFSYFVKPAGGPAVKTTSSVTRQKAKKSDIPVDVYDLANDFISPYWGLDTAGNVITSTTIDFFPDDPNLSTGPAASPVFFFGNSWPLDQKFFLMTVGDTLQLSEPELLVALSGFDQWETYITQADTETWTIVSAARSLINLGRNSIGLHNLSHLINTFRKNQPGLSGLFKPVHMLALRKISTDNPLENQIENDVRILYEWVLNYAQSFYGRQFMVRVPEICVKQDPTTLEYKFNYEVSDGGWNEFNDVEFSVLQGLNIPSAEIDFFRLTDGRIRSFCKFEGANFLNFDQLSDDDYGYIDGGGGNLWVKCNVQQEIVFGDAANLTDPRVVISLPQAVRLKQDNIWVERDGSILSVNQGPSIVWANSVEDAWKDGIQKKTGAESKTAYLSERAVQPFSASFSLRNNQKVYGPWSASNGISIGGDAKFEQDSSLAPWNFGSLAALDQAGNAQASEGVSTMYYSESGSITIPGLPTAKLGDELLSLNGSGYIVNQYEVATRVPTVVTPAIVGSDYLTVNLVAGTLFWVGTYGPIINSISSRVSQSGITTTYELSSFKKKFKKFSKVRLNRLKEIGKLRQDILKNG